MVFPENGLSQPLPEQSRSVNQGRGWAQHSFPFPTQAMIKKASVCHQRLSAVFPAQLPPH